MRKYIKKEEVLVWKRLDPTEKHDEGNPKAASYMMAVHQMKRAVSVVGSRFDDTERDLCRKMKTIEYYTHLMP